MEPTLERRLKIVTTEMDTAAEPSFRGSNKDAKPSQSRKDNSTKTNNNTYVVSNEPTCMPLWHYNPKYCPHGCAYTYRIHQVLDVESMYVCKHTHPKTFKEDEPIPKCPDNKNLLPSPSETYQNQENTTSPFEELTRVAEMFCDNVNPSSRLVGTFPGVENNSDLQSNIMSQEITATHGIPSTDESNPFNITYMFMPQPIQEPSSWEAPIFDGVLPLDTTNIGEHWASEVFLTPKAMPRRRLSWPSLDDAMSYSPGLPDCSTPLPEYLQHSHLPDNANHRLYSTVAASGSEIKKTRSMTSENDSKFMYLSPRLDIGGGETSKLGGFMTPDKSFHKLGIFSNQKQEHTQEYFNVLPSKWTWKCNSTINSSQETPLMNLTIPSGQAMNSLDSFTSVPDLTYKPFCPFCKNSGKPDEVVTSHVMKDYDGKNVCPNLRKIVCPLCHNRDPDTAHTLKYCPMYRDQMLDEAVKIKRVKNLKNNLK